MIEELEGEVFPDRPYRICHEKVAEFIAVTGDDPERWTEAAPPGFAAALLFVVAPELLEDDRLVGSVVHGDQAFTWHRALTMEQDLLVTGSVDRVRARGGAAFVVFSLEARDTGGDQVVEGRSTFVVGPTGDAPAPVVEPADVDQRGPTASVDGALPSPRSASRSDLVRYAAATRDWNPIHWDHASAVAAGLGGVVVHGLLQSAWLTQIAATVRDSDHPLATARFRYTAPLRPAVAATVEGSLEGDSFDLSLVADGVTTVSGRFQVTS